MIYSIQHVTRYLYDVPLVGECFMEARLRPLTLPGQQQCREYHLSTEPSAPIFDYKQPGEMGLMQHFTFRDAPHQTLLIRTDSIVETLIENPFADVTMNASDWQMLSDPALCERYAEWLAPTPLVPLDAVWQGPIPGESVFSYADALMTAIHTEFEYVPGATDVSTPLTQFIAQKRGVCQDYAHLMLATGRAAGIPARYISGYVYAGEESGLLGSGATHAWVEFFLPQDGIWKGFDPTNNLVVADRHIKVAVGRDYADVPPTKGLLRAAPGQRLPQEINLDVQVSVRSLA